MQENQSIRRAFTILQAVATHPDGLRLTSIAAQVQLPKSTVSRLLSTLEGLNLVERTSLGDTFVIGNEFLVLTQSAPFTRTLTTLARPFLLDLSQRTGEAVALCVHEGNEMRVIDLIQTRHLVQVEDVNGRRFPLHATSPGKVLLAFQPDKAIQAYLRQPLTRYTPQTITEPKTFLAQLNQIRRAGFAWAHQELDNISGVSTPVRDDTQHVIAAINLYGPSFRFPPPGTEQQLSQLIMETARQISQHLKSNTPSPSATSGPVVRRKAKPTVTTKKRN